MTDYGEFDLSCSYESLEVDLDENHNTIGSNDTPLPAEALTEPVRNQDVHFYPDCTECMERTTDCVGRPQRVEHGESYQDQYKKHQYIHALRLIEHRIGRINAVRRGEPVASWMDYTEERFGAELFAIHGKMDPENPKYKGILQNYKRDRIEEIKRWMEEEEILKTELIEQGLLCGDEDTIQGCSNREVLFNLRTPICNFTEDDRERVHQYHPGHHFPITGLYKLDKKMELLDVNPETSNRIYFDVPRKPEAYAPENVKHPDVWCPVVPKERADIKYEHLQLMAEIIGKYKYGITTKAFWDIFVKRVHLKDFAQLSNILGLHQPMNFCEEASDIFYFPQEENPFGLVFPANLKDKIPTPEYVFSLIWHDVRTILGDRIRCPTSCLFLDTITGELKRVYNRDVEPSQFGFPDWTELCRYFIKQFGNQHNIAVFDIVLGGKSYMHPELAILRGFNVQRFEWRKKAAEIDYRKRTNINIAKLNGTLNRLNKQISMELKSKYMKGPEPIVRLRLTRGTRLHCFVDNFLPSYPFFLSVVPKALEDTWKKLNAKVTNFYLGREGDMAMIKDYQGVELIQGLHVIVRFPVGGDGYTGRLNSYHRAIIKNRNSEDKVVQVELYDRGRTVIVPYEHVRLMTPEIYYFAPALAIRIRIHVDPIKFPRAVDWGFRKFFKFTDKEMDSVVYEVFLAGDLFVDLVEGFPSQDPLKLQFWSALAEHEPRVMKVPFAGEEDGPPPDLISVRSMIKGDPELRLRFVKAYKSFLANPKENKNPPLVQKLGDPILDPSELCDMTKMTEEDAFRSIDSYYSIPEVENKKKGEENLQSGVLPEIDPMEMVD